MTGCVLVVAAMTTVLYYVHDPMCSWCWGHRPVWDVVKTRLPGAIGLRNVVGGLAADTDLPMPAQQRERIEAIWWRVHELLGTPFNFDFWRDNIPRRSTYMACRAVLAAKQQGLEVHMIDAIQRAYYLRAMNPSDKEVLVGLAIELAEQGHGMDIAQFRTALQSEATEQLLQADIVLARDLTDSGFPSMVLQQDERRTALVLDYQDPEPTLRQIRQLMGV